MPLAETPPVSGPMNTILTVCLAEAAPAASARVRPIRETIALRLRFMVFRSWKNEGMQGIAARVTPLIFFDESRTYFFTSGQALFDSGWNASAAGMVARSL